MRRLALALAALTAFSLSGPVLAETPPAIAPVNVGAAAGPAGTAVTPTPPAPRPRRRCVDAPSTTGSVIAQRICMTEEEWQARQQQQRQTAANMNGCMQDETAGCRVQAADPLRR
jgi:hypothetical protein